MVETYEAEYGKEALPLVVEGHVSIRALKALINPHNPSNPVEEYRFQAIGTSFEELLRGDLSAGEAEVHRNNIYNLGGEVLFEHLPGQSSV